MKIMKWVRYPLLLLAVIFIPISLAFLFLVLPEVISLPNAENWAFFSAIVGYILGYLLIYGFTGAISRSFHLRIYSKRIRTTYLMTNAILSLLLLYLLVVATSLIFGVQNLTFTQGVFFVGLPWVGVQLLLLWFFVRSERLYR